MEPFRVFLQGAVQKANLSAVKTIWMIVMDDRYWQEIYPYIQGSLSYLAATSAGRKRMVQLYTNMYWV